MLIIQPTNLYASDLSINTYHDHRMAMAFAPLAMVVDHVVIENQEVVAKSLPYILG